MPSAASGRKAAFLDALQDAPAYPLRPLLKGRRVLVDDRDPYAARDEGLGDARAHRTHADDGGLRYVRRPPPAGSPGILLVSRAAKKRYILFRVASVLMHSAKPSCSLREACLEGFRQAGPDRLQDYPRRDDLGPHACQPLLCLAKGRFVVGAARLVGAPARLARPGGGPEHREGGPRRSSPSETPSTRPRAWPRFASMASPVKSIFRASVAPTSLGNRCVPPAPGLMPRLTSGMLNLVEAVQTRQRQAMASSSALPITCPATAAATGLGESSTAWNASWKTREVRTASSGRLMSRKRPTSAPALKWSGPPVRMTRPTSGSEFARSIAARSCSRRAKVMAFTGGALRRSTHTPSDTVYSIIRTAVSRYIARANLSNPGWGGAQARTILGRWLLTPAPPRQAGWGPQLQPSIKD